MVAWLRRGSAGSRPGATYDARVDTTARRPGAGAGTAVRDALVGRRVDGRYLIESRIARGGMATVYLALDERLERRVALKVMHAGLAEDEAFVARFQREAKSAARLSHPHVVSVYDQGASDGLVYLAMEYVAGRTVRDVLREHGRLTPEQALTILDPVLQALVAAHRAGFVHRDIKPENVLLGDDGSREGRRLRPRPGDQHQQLDRDPGRAHRHRRVPVPRAGRSAASPTPAATSTAAASCCTRCSRAQCLTPGRRRSPSPTSTSTRRSRDRRRSWRAYRSRSTPSSGRATRHDPDERWHDADELLDAVRVARRELPTPRPLTVDLSDGARTLVVALPTGELAPAQRPATKAKTASPRSRPSRRAAAAAAAAGGSCCSSSCSSRP